MSPEHFWSLVQARVVISDWKESYCLIAVPFAGAA